MKKYAKIENEETKQVSIGEGTNLKFYASIGMSEMEVEQAWDGSWYLKGYCPVKPEPTKEEIRKARENAYRAEVDSPLMAEYTRKKTFNLFEEGEEEALLAEIEAKVAEIKQRYPYLVEESSISAK